MVGRRAQRPLHVVGYCTVFGTYRTANRPDVEQERLASVELAAVLQDLGLGPILALDGDAGRHADLILDVNGRSVALKLTVRGTVTAQAATLLVAVEAERRDPARIVVADRVVEAARLVLREAGWGWFDRRGHLRINAPGVVIDTTVTGAGRQERSSSDPLARQVVQEVATWLLARPQERPRVRDLARRLKRAPSSVSEALKALEERGLATSEQAPLIPELFWELADRWATPRQALSAEPQPGAASLTERLNLGPEEVEQTAGWVLTDTLAAAAYGAPIGVRSGAPPDFLVPSSQIERLAKMFLGAASHSERACTVRATPVRWACEQRIDGFLMGADTHWPLAHPIFVALDLATDPGRGREVLDSWTPPEPWRRVW